MTGCVGSFATLDPPARHCFIPPCVTAVPIRRSQIARTFKATPLVRWFRPSAIQRPAARTLAVPIRRGMPLSAHRRLPVPPPGACWRSCGNRRLCGFLHRDGGENSSERHGSRRFAISKPATIDVTKRHCRLLQARQNRRCSPGATG